jgi:phage terminase large subunit-like protein
LQIDDKGRPLTVTEKQELLAALEERERRKVAESISCVGLTREQSNEVYREVLSGGDTYALRHLCRTDLFFFLTQGCKRRDIDRDWLYDRCREVQAAPDGYLDLWAREHYKSTIITFGKSIQDLLIDPDHTLIGIFSHTRPIAKGFLDQIKRELEQNQYLKTLFPDILYQNPATESPRWSLDGGLFVKRKSNAKEANIEAWGVVDGQPTSKHFTILVYDDVVTRESVSTPDQIKKVTSALELSYNLGAHGGRKRFIGTRYHVHDTYRVIMERGTVKPRIYPATHDGKIDGDPVFLSKETLMEKRRDMGPYTFGTQMLQDPVADKSMSFKPDWLSYYETLGDTSKWNKYILVDPASSKKATSDYTVMEVIGLAPDNNYYLIDAIRDRMNLTQRASKLFELHKLHQPKGVGYERYGMQADIEHVKYVMEQRNYRFNIIELGGTMSKEDRIKKLIPVYEQKRFYSPKRLSFVDCEGVTRDYIQAFNDDEYLAFPVCTHDDMLDCRARILDPGLGAEFPKISPPKHKPQYYNGGGGSNSWMG